MYFIIIIATIFASYNVLVYFGVFESGVGIKKLAKEIDIEKDANEKRRKEKKKLSIYSKTAEYLRVIALPEGVYTKHKYLIERLELRSKVLDRNLTPEELRGKYLLVLFLGIVCIPLGVFFKLIWIVSVFCFVVFALYPARLTQLVQDEDEIIDIYFIDLYLLMYSRLRMGSKARLQTVVESYVDTLQVSANLEMKEVMLKFSKFFLNNLSMYEDHVSVQHLRDRYKSATIINFCNVGSQALQGIDNSDTLLTFKMDLVRRKTDLMRKNAELLFIKGNRAIYLIFLILFIFIGVGWVSKLPTGFF